MRPWCRGRPSLLGLWSRGWTLGWLWTWLLRCGPCLGLGGSGLRWSRTSLWLNRTRLDWTCLRLSRTRLRLSRTCLRLSGTSGLDLRTVLGLDRSGLRLAWTSWLDLRTVRGLHGARLRLVWTSGLYLGTVFRLDRSGLRLAWTSWLYLRTILRLYRSVLHRGGALNARLRCDGAGGGDHGRAAFVYVVELLTVLGGCTLVLKLGRHGRDTGSAIGYQLRRLWPYVEAASAAVIGDAVVDGRVVDDDGAVVDVGDIRDIDAVDRAVVVEVVSVPVAAVIAVAGVAEAVVDATVEADVLAPEAAVEAVAATVEAPVAGGPESTVVRGSAPCAGDPVVAGGDVAPVTGSPEVVGFGGLGLLVDGQRRRRLGGVVGWLTFVSIGTELVVVLRVLSRLIAGVGLILRGRSGLFSRGGVLFGALLGRGLGACPQDARRGSWSRSGGWLAVIDLRRVGVGRVRPGVVWGGCGVGVGSLVAAGDSCGSDESGKTDGKT